MVMVLARIIPKSGQEYVSALQCHQKVVPPLDQKYTQCPFLFSPLNADCLSRLLFLPFSIYLSSICLSSVFPFTVCLWVCAGVFETQVCLGVRGFEWVCTGMRECDRVCTCVHGCAWVCMGVHRCVYRFVQKCAGVCKCICGMNFQNTCWRLESLHQRI